MQTKKFHRKRNRLQWYDYSNPWVYFITICTFEMEHWFGEILDGKMRSNKIGYIAEKYRHAISDIYPDVDLYEMIVMPNHIHGIIALPPGWIINLSRIIKWYKRACTKEIRKVEPWFTWHRTYYDNFIRNQDMYDYIAQYIYENPTKRSEDKFYT